METKKCSKCYLEKTIENFIKRKNSKIGYYAACKECTEIQKKQYRKNNKEKISNQKKDYYIKNKEIIDQKNKNYNLNNKEKILETRKKWALDNQERISQLNKKWFQNNKEKIKNRLKEKRKTDINYRVSKNLRCRIRNAIKIGNKKNTTKELLGCSIEELKKHLELQFREGMTWDNYGPYWHIDHIKPCCAFDLSDVNQQLECFNYKNLQPLLKEENLRKNGKWNYQ